MKKTKIFLLMFFVCVTSVMKAQSPTKTKLMVGIVVDQMRPDYLFRFYDQYGNDGLKRLLNDGFNCRNTHYNYIPTVTACGHASIYTGTTPRYHGIIGNSWFDRNEGKDMYCTSDPSVEILGGRKAAKGVSSKNLLASTITDELKISTNQFGKVISLSLKDRSAALPGGHLPDGAFWFDAQTGEFVSSTYYTKELPEWVKNFNKKKIADQYMQKTWDLLLPKDAYKQSIADDNNYEVIFKGKERPTFPYDLKTLSPLNPPAYEVFYVSPFGNNIITDLTLEALSNTDLGKDEYPDILAISYSSTDAVGHHYGPMSKEIQDTYLRFDREIAKLLKALDDKVGKGNYTVFMTADHGVGEAAQYLTDRNLPGGYFSIDEIKKGAQDILNEKLGEGKWILAQRNNQFYLDRKLISQKGIELSKVQNLLADYLKEMPRIARVLTSTQLEEGRFSGQQDEKLQKGFNYKRSGDVIYELESGWIDEMKTGATHGSGYAYDTHVPLIWFGAGIPKGSTTQHYDITDIAPTISMLLNIKLPSACIGIPIKECLK